MPKTLFVVAGQDGLRLVSENGIDWKNKQMGKEGETYRAACVGNGVCIAVGSYGGGNILSVLTDEKTWKTTPHDAKYVKYLRGLGYGKGFFLGLGGDPGSVGSSKPFIMTTEKGEKWDGPTDIPGKHILRRVAFGNGTFAAVGDRGRRAASRDGKEWTDATETKAIDTLIDIAFGNGVFVGVGLHGLRMTSKDGLAWTDRQLGEEGEHLNSIVWAKDRFVAVGTGATYISSNGVKWERKPNDNAPQAVAFGNGVFAGAAWKGRLLISEDGAKWRETLKAERHVEVVAWGEIAGA